MTRMSKKSKRRAISPRKHRAPSAKTGPKADNLPLGFKMHENGVEAGGSVFIPKVK